MANFVLVETTVNLFSCRETGAIVTHTEKCFSFVCAGESEDTGGPGGQLQ